MSEERMASHRQNYEQQIELSAHKVQKLEEMLRHCTRDYIIGICLLSCALAILSFLSFRSAPGETRERGEGGHGRNGPFEDERGIRQQIL